MIVQAKQILLIISAAFFMLFNACAFAKINNSGQVNDFNYGMVLYDFYQQKYYSATVNLLAAEKQHKLQHNAAEARLLLGGMDLSYGLHDEAEKIFKELIDEGASPQVRDRAWFYIGKIRYEKQLFDEADRALSRVGNALDPSLRGEFLVLKSNLLMSKNMYKEAAKFIETMFKDGATNIKDANFVRYNLGIALIRSGKQEEGKKLIGLVGQLKSNDPDLKALRDKANLALGYSILNTDPVRAKTYFQLVRLNGPFSNRALLGMGWAEAELQRYKQALVPWQVLAGRDRSDVAVLESLVAIGNALERLHAYPQAMTAYQNAINAYNQELAKLENTVAAIKAGRLWQDLLAQVPGDEMGWFWKAELLPNTPETHYLTNLMAKHGFDEGIKNLRDLNFLKSKLDRWQTELPAFDYMLQLRSKTYESQLEKLTPEKTLNHVIDVRTTRDIYANELKEIEANHNGLALATEKEHKQLAKLASVEEKIWHLSNNPKFGQAKAKKYRERYKFLQGVLEYKIQTTYAERVWNLKKRLKSLDTILESTLVQQKQLQKARKDAPLHFQGYAQKISGYNKSIKNLLARVNNTFQEQQNQLQDMVDKELDRIRLRLVNYLDRAQFSLAHLQDIVTSSGSSSEGEGSVK
jgi:tetratricopeptide (TPR) repeat protein